MAVSGELLTQLKPRSGPPPIVVVTKLQSLPFGSLRWDDFEKLCMRVVLLDHEVEDARRYGVPGQDQGGIDLYARCAKNGKYTAYQCKKVDRLGPAYIGSAVDLFLAGPWANKVATFVICCSVSFAATQMANQLEAERERLVRRGVTLEAWDADALNIRLKGQPLLVEEFFGC